MINKFDDTVKLGKNVKIKSNVELHYVHIGDNVVIGKNTTIFGSETNIVTIGDNSYISPNCYFNGAYGLIIGEEVTISAGVMIFSDSGPNVGPLREAFPTENALIKISYGSWIGAGSILLPGSFMEETSVLAANSMLKKRVQQCQVFGGNPAQLIKTIKLKK